MEVILIPKKPQGKLVITALSALQPASTEVTSSHLRGYINTRVSVLFFCAWAPGGPFRLIMIRVS